ncbi:histidine kinase [Chitinophaga niastensis]|uniref:Histidine kinase n=1 Tax=Chitinophaga niastensis TaxID=536980 RepID=A0A2P8HCD8_CHINA|nr:histidine kinase [Chitinophaga niastensis]PSL43900.1 histidine kinase [Chitinophaga niastensis]
MKKHLSISLYWKCQLIGWSVASLYWGYTGLTGPNFNLLIGIFHFIADVTINILLTHIYRNYVLQQNWNALGPKALVWKIIPAILILATAFTLTVNIRFYLFYWYLAPGPKDSFWQYLLVYGPNTFIGGVRLMSIWVLAYHMYQYAQREINTTKENARLAIIAKEAQLSNLSAQLNPHFFFNSLNNIKALVIENPVSARRAIDLLSDLLRTALYGKTDKLIAVQDELSLVKDYLELEKLRMEERLQVRFSVDMHLVQTRIPPLSIQTLVENAIKHGIDKCKDGGLIDVQVTSSDGLLKICVENPGILSKTTPMNGLGLKNLSERLQLEFNNKATLSIVQVSGEKVLTTILIPVA